MGALGGFWEEKAPEVAGELAFEAAERFAVALAFGELLLEVGACGWVHADLGEGDAAQRGVELPVTARVEAVAGAVA